jgi:hypothetical protein
MQFGKWSQRLIAILGALIFVALGILFVLGVDNSRNNQKPATNSSVLKILVDETGLYQVDLIDLESLSQDIESLSADNLNLTEGGVQVPYFLDGDVLYFYGASSDSRYATYRPYLLSINEPGLLMEEINMALTVGDSVQSIAKNLLLEENNLYDSRSISDEEPYPNFIDPWYWTVIQYDDEFAVEFTLENIDYESSAILRTALYGATSIESVDPDHDVDLILNGTHIDTITWDGEKHTLSESTVKPGILQNGSNTLIFNNRSSQDDSGSIGSSSPPLDIIRLDWFEIDYSGLPRAEDDVVLLDGVSGNVRIEGFTGAPRVVDITDPAAPKLVTGIHDDENSLGLTVPEGVTLLAAGPEGIVTDHQNTPVQDSKLSDSSIQADFIILSTTELSPTLTPLVDWREAQGLSVVQAAVEDVYNEFGYGEESPESIANFVSYALSEWQEPYPTYLLIVGDASYDYKNYLDVPGPNMIPAPMVRVVYGGETVSDARLGDINLDGWPDIAVGRWPVSTRREAEELVQRTIAYEQGTSSDKILLAADGTSPEFSSLSDSVFEGSNLPNESAQRLYGVPSSQLTDAWNDGAWLVSYAGHGSIDRWGKEDVFSAGAVPDLHSAGPPPIVLQLTCLTGFYAHPNVDSISEQMLRHENGPVEIVAATSLTLSSSQKPFGISFLKELQDPENARIGDALQRAKQSLDVENSRALREISETFLLLGDPSALIVRP